MNNEEVEDAFAAALAKRAEAQFKEQGILILFLYNIESKSLSIFFQGVSRIL